MEVIHAECRRSAGISEKSPWALTTALLILLHRNRHVFHDSLTSAARNPADDLLERQFSECPLLLEVVETEMHPSVWVNRLSSAFHCHSSSHINF